MLTICSLCQQAHTSRLQDKLCKLRLEIINLRLELRELLADECKLSEMLNQRKIAENWRLATKTDPLNPTESVELATDSANGF